MNIPGTTQGNWIWRCPPGLLTPALADWLDLDGNVLITNDPFDGVRNLDGRLTFDGAPAPHGLQTLRRDLRAGLPA